MTVDSKILKHIKEPSFFVNTDIVKRNIKTAIEKIPKGVDFRPHFKTHNSIEIGEIFKDFGISKICVSSLEMAKKFYLAGFKDICIAFPINLREFSNIEEFASKLKLSVCVSNNSAADYLSKHSSIPLSVYIEINLGQNRSGFCFDDIQGIKASINKMQNNKNLKFKGFLNHNGSTYKMNTIEEIVGSTEESILKMLELKNYFAAYNPIISVGDTPGFSHYNNFTKVDELRPGNFVYYDLMQLKKFKSCNYSDIAATLVCPVVDINKKMNRIIVHGGSVHLSSESILLDNIKIYGQARSVINTNVELKNSFVIELSQEHGIIETTKENLTNVKLGDLIEVIPVHSCITANSCFNKTLYYS